MTNLQIYKYLLKRFRWYYWIEYFNAFRTYHTGMCRELNKLHELDKISVEQVLIYKLPELWNNKPLLSDEDNYWFTLDRKGDGQRIELLKRVIAQIEQPNKWIPWFLLISIIGIFIAIVHLTN